MLATHLLVSAKKGISAYQIHHQLGATLKTTCFMCHHIREAMRDTSPSRGRPIGGADVEQACVPKSVQRFSDRTHANKAGVWTKYAQADAKVVGTGES